MGVIKNIIPAVASTNAIVSAACVGEAVKLLTYVSQSLNTYHMYMGSQGKALSLEKLLTMCPEKIAPLTSWLLLLRSGVYSHTFVYERKEDCPVCTQTVRKITLKKDDTLNQMIQKLCEGDLRLKTPSMTTTTKTLYMQKPPALEKATRKNLDKPVSSLVESGEEVTVTDPVLENINLSLAITFA